MDSLVKVRKVIDVEVRGLGKRIKAARKASPLTLTKLAELAGISRAYWYDIESEQIRDSLPIETLRQIEQALGVSFGVE